MKFGVLSGGQVTNDPEADVPCFVVWLHLVAPGRPTVLGDDVEAATTADLLHSLRWTHGVSLRRQVVRPVPVRDPLRDVAVHVVEPPLVGSKGADRSRRVI